METFILTAILVVVVGIVCYFVGKDSGDQAGYTRARTIFAPKTTSTSPTVPVVAKAKKTAVKVPVKTATVTTKKAKGKRRA